MKTDIPDREIDHVLDLLGYKEFSTYDFIIELRKAFPKTWKDLEKTYGPGGKGANTKYSAYSRAASKLKKWCRDGKLDALEHRKADPSINWSHRLIKYWARDQDNIQGNLYPDEMDHNDPDYKDGASKQVLVNKYERDPKARTACIKHHGFKCSACNFDFENVYGDRGKQFIHVHHRVAVSTYNGSKGIDPVKDLIPVCPNCHAMLHRKNDGLTVEALREILMKKPL